MLVETPPPSRGAGRRKVNQNNANAAPPHPPPPGATGRSPQGKEPVHPTPPTLCPAPGAPLTTRKQVLPPCNAQPGTPGGQAPVWLQREELVQ